MASSSNNLAQDRARRLLYIRKEVLRITRDELSQFSKISPNSLQNWEQMRNKGLTEEGAKRLVEAFRQKGLNCTVEWLMFGTGFSPIGQSDTNTLTKPVNEDELIEKELSYFKQLNGNVLDHIVNDDSMLPVLWPGDCVAGKYYEGDAVKHAVDLPCIIETKQGNKLIRILQTGDEPNLYNLVCSNNNSFVKKFIANIEVNKVAPILWIRRRSYIK